MAAAAGAAAAARGPVDGRASTTAGCRRSRWPGGWSPRAGSATIRHVRAQYLQDWIVDPRVPAGLAAAEGAGRLRRARRHRRAHRRPRPVRHRRSASPGCRGADRDVRPASARCPRRRAGLSAPRRRGEPATVTVDDAALFLGRLRRRRAGVVRGHPVRDRPQERASVEINGSRGQPRLRLRGDERAAVLRRAPSPDDRRASAGSWSPSPTHPYVGAWWPPGHGLGYEHGSPTRSSTWSRRSPRARSPRPSFADGLQVQRVLAAVERSSAEPSAAGSTDRRLSRRPRRTDHDPTDHPVHRPVGRPAVRGGRAGSPPSGATTASRSPAGATTSTSTGPLADDAYVDGQREHPRASTASRSARSPTTSSARPSATTRSTSGTRASCPPGSGATATPRACGSGPPRR